MTSSVKIASNNFPVLVRQFENGILVSEELVLVGDDISTKEWYITTSRSVRFIDLAADDERVVTEKERRINANR